MSKSHIIYYDIIHINIYHGICENYIIILLLQII